MTFISSTCIHSSTGCSQEAKEKLREASHTEEFARAELNKVLKRVKEVGGGQGWQ